MIGTGLRRACITKQPRSAFRTTRATSAGSAGESISSVVSAPSIAPITVSLSTDPVTRYRARTRIRIPVTLTFSMCPYLDTWVISQKASAALKDMRGVGAEPSPPSEGPSSHAKVL